MNESALSISEGTEERKSMARDATKVNCTYKKAPMSPFSRPFLRSHHGWIILQSLTVSSFGPHCHAVINFSLSRTERSCKPQEHACVARTYEPSKSGILATALRVVHQDAAQGRC